jgi:beta-glucanase (GH16 family)
MSRRRTPAVASALAAVTLLALLGPAPSQATPVRAPHRVTGTTVLLPPVVQPGGRVAAASRARLSGTVRFTPARRGRPVVVQRRLPGGPWRALTTRRQGPRGVVAFTAKASRGGRPFTYRGVAPRYRGLPRVAARAASAAGWHTRFTDEFSGSTLDPAHWDYRALGHSGVRRTRSVSAEDAVDVRDGSLRLSVRADPDDPTRYHNGHVGTQGGRFAFTYGVAAARVRFERGVGQHGGFWLQPEKVRKLRGYPGRSGAEIDVAEYFGAGRTASRLGSYLYNYGILDSQGEPRRMGRVFARANAMLPPGDDWWKSYHVFSVEWTPTSYTFRVDGRTHWRTTVGVSHVPEYLILSLLTSDYELPALDDSSLPSTLNVDWVRVWQR